MAALRVGRRMRFKKGSVRAGTKRRGVASGQGITTQRDSRRIYTRRRAPRRLRRRMRKAFNSFKSKALKMKGHRTIITNHQVAIAGLANQQSVTSFVLYGGRVDGAVASSISRGYDDMNDLRSRDYKLGDSTGDPDFKTSGGEAKFYVKTGVMDITIQNVGGNEGETFALEVDVYEFTCGKIIPGYSDVEGALAGYQQDIYKLGTLSTKLTALNLLDRGVTPFEMGTPMYRIGMRILKKTKYFIPYNDVITYQTRDSKIRCFGHEVFRDGSCTTKHTRGILIIAKPVPGSAFEGHNMTVGVTRKYKYVVDEGNLSRANEWDPIG